MGFETEACIDGSSIIRLRSTGAGSEELTKLGRDEGSTGTFKELGALGVLEEGASLMILDCAPGRMEV